MGLIQKKDEDKDYIDGIEVIGRGEGPDDDSEVFDVELHEGATAEDISGTTAAREGELETEADPELLSEVDEVVVEDEDAEEDANDDADDDMDDADAAEDGAEDAAVEDEDDLDDDAEDDATPEKRSKTLLIGGVIAVVIAAVIGYFIGSGGFGSHGVSGATFAEDKLDNVVATWSYNGATHKITAREAIESQYSLEAAQLEDGTYSAPSAETILSYVRNQVLIADAEAKGMTVDDDELASAAEETLGTSDFEQIGQQYGMTEDQVQQVLREQVLIEKLYNSVVQDAPVAPEAPAEPAEEDADTATKEYAEYIIGLAGEAWDAKAGTWADENSDYAQAFVDRDFTGETATYEDAQIAYYVAYQVYANQSSTSSDTWTTYVNELFAKSNLSLYGLFA